jgi:hypothetical protein
MLHFSLGPLIDLGIGEEEGVVIRKVYLSQVTDNVHTGIVNVRSGYQYLLSSSLLEYSI